MNLPRGGVLSALVIGGPCVLPSPQLDEVLQRFRDYGQRGINDDCTY